ncbi:MAG: signal recognition particle-docking protein FtsY, partial [Chlamydiia bacterium]|nr:signal recognition particle-docking protein FtsY [Chlamydiia bacterium]
MILKFLKSSYEKVCTALKKSKSALGDKLAKLFGGGVDEETFEQLEELLYEADLGVKLATEITERFKKHLKNEKELKGDALIERLIQDVLQESGDHNHSQDIHWAPSGPTVILIVGVNGNGKTTSVAKLAKKIKSEGKQVLICARDTFRAAAVEQLDHWANRAGVDIVKSVQGGDASAVVYDGLQAAVARKADVVIVDTAGRLHSKKALMQELEKMRNVCEKVIPNSPHEVLLVLDATTGQNAIDQARTFNQYTDLDGIVLTKLDGTARGGIALAIQKELAIPVKYIGVGEGIDDL